MPELEATVDEDDEDPEDLIISRPRRRAQVDYSSVSAQRDLPQEGKERVVALMLQAAALEKAGLKAGEEDEDDDDEDANPESPNEDGGSFITRKERLKLTRTEEERNDDDDEDDDDEDDE